MSDEDSPFWIVNKVTLALLPPAEGYRNTCDEQR